MVLAFIHPNENNMHFLESSIARGSAACLISYVLMVKKQKDMTTNVLDNNKNLTHLLVRNIIIVIHSNVFALSQLYLS